MEQSLNALNDEHVLVTSINDNNADLFNPRVYE